MSARRSEPSDWDLRARYTLNAEQAARLLGMSRDQLYDRLVDAAGKPVKWSETDPAVPVFLSWVELQVPARRNTNGDLMFLTADFDAVFVDSRRLHPSVGSGR